MTIDIKEQELGLLYNKAKKNYKECISNKENGFLKDEVDVPVESIMLMENDIKIVFSKNIGYAYLLEVSLLLYADNNAIGKYIYMENETGSGLDDSLIFY